MPTYIPSNVDVASSAGIVDTCIASATVQSHVRCTELPRMQLHACSGHNNCLLLSLSCHIKISKIIVFCCHKLEHNYTVDVVL